MRFSSGILLILSFVLACQADESVESQSSESPCVIALRRYPKPDVTYTAKHLWNSCPELCRNSSGHHPTGQHPHPWDCNAFINCYNDDAWVAWCQVGLFFNEKNLQCDYPRNVNCSRSQPQQFSLPPGLTTQSQWVLIPTTPSPNKIVDQPDVLTCKDSDSKLNDRELLGSRPDLCKEGTGNYRTPDCRFYVKCFGIQAYVARCPAGFVFDPIARQCDWPSKNPTCFKSCLNSGTYDNVETTTQKPQTTTPLMDADLRAENLTCNESHCIPKEGCQAELCKLPRGQFQVPGSCSRFANCWDSCAYLTDCPSGMVFTDLNGICDNPWSLPTDHACYRTAYGNTIDNTASSASPSSDNLVQSEANFNGPLQMKQSQSMNGGNMVQAQW